MRIRTGEGGRPAFAAEDESLSLGWRVCLRAGVYDVNQFVKGVPKKRCGKRTHEGAETFGQEALVPDGVGRVFVQDGPDGDGVGEQFRDVSPGPFRLDRGETARVEKDVPVAERDGFLVRLLVRQAVKLCHLSAAPQVVLVLVRFPQPGPVPRVLVVLGPPLFRGVGGEPAMGALELDVYVLVVLFERDGAVGEVADAVALCAHLGERGFRQRVEEVVLAQEGLFPLLLGGVILRGLLAVAAAKGRGPAKEGALGCDGEASARSGTRTGDRLG